jgi:hypothetical protein
VAEHAISEGLGPSIAHSLFVSFTERLPDQFGPLPVTDVVEGLTAKTNHDVSE